MYGPDINTLNLYIDKYIGFNYASYTRSTVWKKAGSQGNKWLQGRKTIFSDSFFKIVFEGVVGKSYQGDIALDDISATLGACPPSKVCDFEIDFCDYSVDNSTVLEWKRGSSSDGTTFYDDHTTSTQAGNFAYLNTGVGSFGDKGLLKSKQYRALGNECLQFWYLLDGNEIGSLNIYTTMSNNVIWSRAGRTGTPDWHYGQITIYGQRDFGIIFEGIKGRGNQGIIAIDDILLISGSCPPPVNCNFEDTTLCSWSQYKYDDMDWLLNQGKTDTTNTGPHVDVTTGSDLGWYIYLESSYPAKVGEKAILVSELLDSTSSSCFTLWYFMYGTDVGSFSVYTNDTNNGLQLLGKVSGNQGFTWYKFSQEVKSYLEYQIVLEGVIGNGFLADIAIDDITYSNGSCNIITSTPSPITTLPPTLINDFSCDFECDCFCKWTADPTGQFGWTLRKGPTPSIFTGPPFDHTTQSSNGVYAYIETSSPQKQNDSARILSPNLNIDQSGVCFKFFYYMYGSDVYRLNVYAKSGDNLGKPIWQKEGEKGNSWLLGHIFIESFNGPLQLVMEGVAGKGERGDIAIDDLSVNIGECPPSSVCDFESSDLCGYKNDVLNDFDWKRIQGNNVLVDHTYGTDVGHFMSATASLTQFPGEKARILSTIYPAATLCANFWYKIVGDVSLNVRSYAFGILGNPILSLSGDRGNEWSLGLATISQPYSYQIIFEAVVGSAQRLGSVFVDDIEIKFGTCPLPASCNFESGFCGYTNYRTDDFDWIILDGEFGLEFPFIPNIDHTTGTPQGNFLYLDSDIRKQGDTAIIESEALNGNNQTQCLEYYLFFKGSPGYLSVIRKNLFPISNQTLLTDAYETNSIWIYRNITIRPNTIPFKVIFQGTVGTSSGGIAIDDIKYYQGECKGLVVIDGQFDCNNGESVDQLKVCDFVNDCSNGLDEKYCGNCNFETDQCGWKDVSNGSFMWYRKNNGSLISGQPMFDHTLNNNLGFYMNVGIGNGLSNTPATLMSVEFPQASSTCQIKFWYFYFGGTGSINASLYIDEEKEVTLFKRRANENLIEWKQGVISLGRINRRFKVAFEALRPLNYIGFIAIDDITFDQCSLPATNLTCSNNDFKCNRGSCIPKDRLCDIVDDCGDFSDEYNRFCSSYSR